MQNCMRYNDSKFYKNESNENHVTAESREKDSNKASLSCPKSNASCMARSRVCTLSSFAYCFKVNQGKLVPWFYA